MFLFLTFFFLFFVQTTLSNDKPVIGVLTQKCLKDFCYCSNYPSVANATDYLPASYIKWLEGGGARAIPILVGEDHELVKELLPQLNGVLFVGKHARLLPFCNVHKKS